MQPHVDKKHLLKEEAVDLMLHRQQMFFYEPLLEHAQKAAIEAQQICTKYLNTCFGGYKVVSTKKENINTCRENEKVYIYLKH